LSERLAHLESGEAQLIELDRAARETRDQYMELANALIDVRREAANRLCEAVMAELPPLRLDKARFFVEVTETPETTWSAAGSDQVRFLIATNPGQEPGPLAKIASGGELSRLMLALKVVLSAGSTVPTLVFDEVDSGVGGATAASVGERLVRVAEMVQVLVVTHSPQVAARGAAHFLVSKAARDARTATTVEPLGKHDRREEIARMLAGEKVTAAARAAAADLLGAAG
jgi:DNA repair protein RecN (Recombination protein N)